MTDAPHPVSGAETGEDRVLDLRDICRIRERGGVRFELHLPRMTLQRGSFAAIIGESGCGKSTLLDMLGLILRPSSATRFTLHPEEGAALDILDLWGRAAEEDLADLRRERLGYVLQTGGLFSFLTARENIVLQARLRGMTLEDAAVEAAARRLRIEEILPKKPATLSGGQRQRTAILRALIHGPSIVLADEPTAAVDRPQAEEIFRDFGALARESGVTIIVVTHAPDLVAPYADRTFTFALTREGNTTVSTCHEVTP